MTTTPHNHDDYDLQSRYFERNPLAPELRACGDISDTENEKGVKELDFDHSDKRFRTIDKTGLFPLRKRLRWEKERNW